MEKPSKYADRGGNRNQRVSQTEWGRIMEITSQVQDSHANALLIQLSRVRLIPMPTPDNAPQLIEAKIRQRAKELENSGMRVVANTILQALSQI